MYIIRLLAILLIIPYAQLFGQNEGHIDLDAAQFKVIVAQEPGILLDVRTLREYRQGYLAGAEVLNYYERGFRERLLLLPKDRPVYLYCNTGYRSGRAARILTSAGYTKVYNMRHGIMEWNIHDFPVEYDPNAEKDTENLVNKDEFDRLVNNEPLLFVDFYAPWCAPCREMMPMIDELLPAYHNDIHLLKVNVDASRKLAKEMKLKGVPYLVLYRNGETVFEHFGKLEAHELRAVFDNELAKPSNNEFH